MVLTTTSESNRSSAAGVATICSTVTALARLAGSAMYRLRSVKKSIDDTEKAAWPGESSAVTGLKSILIRTRPVPAPFVTRTRHRPGIGSLAVTICPDWRYASGVPPWTKEVAMFCQFSRSSSHRSRESRASVPGEIPRALALVMVTVMPPFQIPTFGPLTSNSRL